MSATHYCDGARDCADGSEETNDACATNSGSEFRSEAVSLRVASLPCILPPYPEHGAYSTDIAGAEPGQGYDRVTLSDVTCERGYVARGSTSREFSCSLGVWTGTVPRC
ncbi:Pattern recognition serine proteinase, partial [Operophtera brumata]